MVTARVLQMFSVADNDFMKIILLCDVPDDTEKSALATKYTLESRNQLWNRRWFLSGL